MSNQIGFSGYDHQLHSAALAFQARERSVWSQIELCCGPHFLLTRFDIPRCPKCAALEKSIYIPQEDTMPKRFYVTVVGHTETFEGTRSEAIKDAEARFTRDYVKPKGWRASHWIEASPSVHTLMADHPDHRAMVAVANVSPARD